MTKTETQTTVAHGSTIHCNDESNCTPIAQYQWNKHHIIWDEKRNWIHEL